MGNQDLNQSDIGQNQAVWSSPKMVLPYISYASGDHNDRAAAIEGLEEKLLETGDVHGNGIIVRGIKECGMFDHILERHNNSINRTAPRQ
jgi:hypothetical protein